MRWFNKKKSTALEKLASDKTLMVTYDELSQTPYDKVEDVYKERPNAVTFYRVRNVDNNSSISFKVTMKAGESWNNHYHNCKETILVYKGTIYNAVNKEKVKELEVMEINPYEKHIIKALEDTVFYVEFKNPQINK